MSVLPHEAKYMPWLFCHWSNTKGWSSHVTSTIQRDTTCCGLELWLSPGVVNLSLTMHLLAFRQMRYWECTAP